MLALQHTVITPARAKALIGTYPEVPGFLPASLSYTSWLTGPKGPRRRPTRASSPRPPQRIYWDEQICVTTTGDLVHGLGVLVNVIRQRRAAELWVCVVDDAELIEDLFDDLDPPGWLPPIAIRWRSTSPAMPRIAAAPCATPWSWRRGYSPAAD
jgi:hypothetical protein